MDFSTFYHQTYIGKGNGWEEIAVFLIGKKENVDWAGGFVGITREFVGISLLVETARGFVGIRGEFVDKEKEYVGIASRFVGITRGYVGIRRKFVDIEKEFVEFKSKFLGKMNFAESAWYFIAMRRKLLTWAEDLEEERRSV